MRNNQVQFFMPPYASEQQIKRMIKKRKYYGIPKVCLACECCVSQRLYDLWECYKRSMPLKIYKICMRAIYKSLGNRNWFLHNKGGKFR